MAQCEKINASGGCRAPVFLGRVNNILSAVVFGLMAVPAWAERIETLPIVFDLAAISPVTVLQTAAAQAAVPVPPPAPTLIAAYQPTAQMPRLIRFSSAQGIDAVTSPAGAPKPSVIVGVIASGREGDFGLGTLLPDTIAQYAFAYDDLVAREALRAADPVMFRTLVRQGHIDPPAGQIAVALQKELQRMNCYRSGIDGSWGAGSRRAVTEYFTTRGISAGGLGAEASAELFRAVVLNGDTTCIVAASVTPPKAQQSRRTTPSTAAKPAAAKPRAQAARKPAATTTAAKPKPSGGASITGGGIGFLR